MTSGLLSSEGWQFDSCSAHDNMGLGIDFLEQSSSMQAQWMSLPVQPTAGSTPGEGQISDSARHESRKFCRLGFGIP